MTSITLQEVVDSFGKRISYDTWSEPTIDRYEKFDAYMTQLQLANKTLFDKSEKVLCNVYNCCCKQTYNLFKMFTHYPISIVKDISYYLFENNYLSKDNLNFQQIIHSSLYHYGWEESHYEENTEYFEYALNYLCLPETIMKTHNCKYCESPTKLTLLHKAIRGVECYIDSSLSLKLSPEYISRIFKICDNNGFDYTVPHCDMSLLETAVNFKNYSAINELLTRGFSINEEIVYKLVGTKLRNCLSLRHKIDLKIRTCVTKEEKFWNKVYSEIYDSDELLMLLSQSDIPQDKLKSNVTKIMKSISKNYSKFTLYESDCNYLYSSYSRKKLIYGKKEEYLSVLELLKFCFDKGLDKTKKIDLVGHDSIVDLNSITFYEIYLRGCKPFKLLLPEIHEQFMERLIL